LSEGCETTLNLEHGTWISESRTGEAEINSAILLAAGSGTKTWPFNEVRNKCAFPIANVPAVRRLADQLVTLGVERLVVVIGPGEGSIRRALHGLSVSPRYLSQPSLKGTAPAALAGLEILDSDAWVVYGDIVTAPENLLALKERFEAERPPAAVLLDPLTHEEGGNWICGGIREGRLSGIQGHPRGAGHRLGGVFLFRKEATDCLRDNPGLVTQVPVGGMPPVEADLASSLQLLLDDGEAVAAVEASGYLVDLDRPWHLMEATHRVIEDEGKRLAEDQIHPTARVDDSAEIHGRLVLGESAVIGKRVVAGGNLWLGKGGSVTNGSILNGPVSLGMNSRVRDYAMLGGHSAMGPQSLLGHGGEFDGVMLERAYLYHYCEISGIVGAAVDIGAASVCGTLRFDDAAQTTVVNGRRETPSSGSGATYFGDYSRTGVNAILMPGTKIGAYSCVGPGVVLSEDLPSRTLVQVKQELVKRPWGPERYGW
jgi:bifunctional UDP-N-acetylglucosamine pyrophosphorylase/glucosamine-1-phosphate N-acetyltransferase